MWRRALANELDGLQEPDEHDERFRPATGATCAGGIRLPCCASLRPTAAGRIGRRHNSR
jgi:hypothetical protein